MGRSVTILLALSLAANVFLGGFVAGRIAGPSLSGFDRAGSDRPGTDRHHGGPGGHGPHRSDPFAEFDELPPAVREKLKALFRKNRESIASTFREGRALHQEFVAVLTADAFDRAAAEDVAARIEAFERDRRPSMPRVVIEAMDGLSAADRRALAAIVERRMIEDLKGRGRRHHRRFNEDEAPPPPQ